MPHRPSLPLLPGLFATALAAASCLPGDERPEPGRLLVSARPSAALTDGFTTDDGWAITFDSFVTALGGIDLENEEGGDSLLTSGSCVSYSGTNYEWLMDLTRAKEEKVGLVYGLGTCSVEWRFRGPSSDTALGVGVDDADLAAMNLEETDAYNEEARPATLRVIAAGTKDDVTVRIDWTFRRSFSVEDCVDENDEKGPSLLELEGGEESSFIIEVRGEELFRPTPEDEAPLTFESIALADADGDGMTTLEELALVPAPPQPPPEEEELDDDEEPIEIVTMADLVYVRLLPRVTRGLGSAACDAERRGR